MYSESFFFLSFFLSYATAGKAHILIASPAPNLLSPFQAPTLEVLNNAIIEGSKNWTLMLQCAKPPAIAAKHTLHIIPLKNACRRSTWKSRALTTWNPCSWPLRRRRNWVYSIRWIMSCAHCSPCATMTRLPWPRSWRGRWISFLS